MRQLSKKITGRGSAHRGPQVVAMLALLIALGGTAQALKRNSVGKREIEKNSIVSNHVRDNKLKSKDFRDDHLRGKDFRDNSLSTLDLRDGVGVSAADVVPDTLTGAEIDESSLSGVSPGGPAGGDLTGSFPNPLIAGGAVTGAKIAPGGVGPGKLADGAVQAPAIADGSVGTAAIQDGAVGTGALADGSVGFGSTIANDAVTGSHIANDTLGAVDVQTTSLGAPLLSEVTFETASSGAPDGLATKTAEATCTSGRKAIGGGGLVQGTGLLPPSEVALVGSEATSSSPPNAWQVEGKETAPTSEDWSVTAYVVCADGVS